MTRTNNDAYLYASAYEAAAQRNGARRGLTAGDVMRVTVVVSQAIALLFVLKMTASEDAMMVVPLFYMALLPFYVLRRPNSSLHMPAPALALIWASLGTLYAFGAATAATDIARLSWHFVMGMAVAPTSFLLFPVLKFAKTALPIAHEVKALIAIAVFAVAFYVQWFKFVPWLFADTAPQKPANYFRQ